MASQQSATVVVTGASAGVGRAVAAAFGRQKARVALLARGRAGLEGAREDVHRLGGEALVLPTDVADADQVEAAAEETEKRFGPIDVWVNVAMVSVFSRARDLKPAEVARVTEVTYLGYVYGTLAAMNRMIPRNRGSIVQVGSALAYRSIPLQAAYCGAKHAIQGFTDSVRCELLHDSSNVTISIVHLPAVNTPQFDWVKSRLPRKPQPVPPIYQPEVVADAIVWAAQHYRREWWVGASTAAVITGQKIAPGLADHYLAETGFDSQQYDGSPANDRQNNLYEPVDEERDYGAHGDFDARAHAWSLQFFLSKYRLWLGLAAAGLATTACLVSRSKQAKSQRLISAE